MKPDTKAMLPVLNVVRHTVRTVGEDEIVYLESEVLEWLDKLTEGAEQKTGFLDDDGFVVCGPGSVASTHTALLICPREINQAVPLNEVIEFLDCNRYSANTAAELASRLKKFGVK